MEQSRNESMNHLCLSGRGNAVLFLLFLMLAFAVYGRTLGHGFIFNWDDPAYVTGNEAVRGFTPAHLKLAFSSFYVGNYAPLHIISYMLDYTFWGMDPKGYHLSGILIHACNGYLAYRLFLSLDGRQAVALAAALLFLLHPVQVESVAWISERKTLLSMFFSLLSLRAYLACCTTEPGVRARWYAASLLFLLAALLCKAAAIVIPLVMVAYDWYAGGREGLKKGLAGKMPFLAMSFLLALITVMSQHRGKMLSPYIDDNPLNNVLTMMPVFARYLGLIFWPAHLSPIYGPPIKTTADLEVVLSAALFVTVLAAGLYLLYRRRLAGFCLTFFLLGLLPVSHIFPLPTLMQDRYLYFPLLGFSLCAVAWAADAASGRFGAKGANFACSVALILALLLAYVSYGQAAVWNNAEGLWSHAVKVVPRSWQAWNMLAATRHDLKDFAGAEDAYLHLLAISPREKLGLVGIGTLYGERGDIEKSLHYLRQAVDIAPDDPDVLVNFGFAQFLNGDLEACRTSFQRAVVINPQLIGKLLPTLLEVASRQNDQEEVLRLKSLIKRGQANFMN